MVRFTTLDVDAWGTPILLVDARAAGSGIPSTMLGEKSKKLRKPLVSDDLPLPPLKDCSKLWDSNLGWLSDLERNL